MTRWIAILWSLGAVIPALALVILPPDGRFLCFVLAVFLETGHSLSPIVLAWSHRDFRRKVVLSAPIQFIALPAAMFCLALLIGTITSVGWTTYLFNVKHQMTNVTDWTNPFPVLVWAYLIWNAFHFGMQNFGVLALAWPSMPKNSHRIDFKLGCVILTAIGMYGMPNYFQSWTVGMICIGAFSFNHWIVAIGLSSRASRHGWVFIAAVLGAGAIGFVWMIPTSDVMIIRAIPWIISARLGLGFIHFLYDRWVWRMSNPQIRSIIAPALFA